MLRFIMEKNVLLYVLAVACAVSVVSQMMLRRIYDGLLKNTRNDGEPEGRFLQQLRQRFQYCGHLNGRVGDVHALIQKSLLEYRAAGISLHGFERLGLGCFVVSLLCALAGTMVRMQGGAAVVTGNVYFWLGAGTIFLTALAYGLADVRYRSRALEICLLDYLENSGVADSSGEKGDLPELEYEAGTERTVAAPAWEGRRTKRRTKTETAASRTRAGKRDSVTVQREYDSIRPQRGSGSAGKGAGEEDGPGYSSAKDSTELVRASRDSTNSAREQRDKSELRESLSRVKTGMRESAASDTDHAGGGRGAELLREMDPKEQERIIREVLSEFLSH